MTLSHPVAYNTFVQILGKAVTLIFGITTTALLTNYLGSAGFGDYIFALSFVAIFSGIADWGTTLITVKEAAREEKNQGQLFANVLLLRFGLSILAMLAVWLVIFFFPLVSANQDFLRRLVILSSTLIVIFGLKTSLGIIFQTKLKMGRGAVVDLTASLATLIFSFLIIKISGSLFSLIGVIILANLVALLLAFFLVRPLTSLNFTFSLPILRRITHEALPMGGTLILYSVYNRFDILILQVIKGSQTVGIYGLAYRIYEILILGAFYFMNSLLPIIAKENDKSKLCQIFQNTLDILILGGGFAFLGTAVFAPLAIKIVAWQKFGEFFISIPLLRILGLAVFVSFLNHLNGYTIVVLGEQRKYFFIALVALFFNLTANLLFIPTFSYFAAAWITVLTELLVFGLTSFLLFRKLKFIPNFLSFPKTGWELLKNLCQNF